MDWKPQRFQRDFIQAVKNPAFDLCVLSVPRGNGKSSIAGLIVSECLTPGTSLFRHFDMLGQELVLFSPSLEQSRIVYRMVRDRLEGNGFYRWQDSTQKVGIVHVPTNTRLRAHGGNAKTSFGLHGVPLIVLDEPGALETIGGEMLFDSLQTAQGKPGSKLKAILIGTQSPARSGWWIDLVKRGSHDDVYVQALIGNKEKWNDTREILRVNPLARLDPDFKRKLLLERDEAVNDSRLRARFMSFRLNLPSTDEATMLLSVNDWEQVLARPVPERKGQPIVGVDLGGGRAWSGATALFANGRIECLAVTAGIPSIADQERRDLVNRGDYQRLVDSGHLIIAKGVRVPHPSMLIEAVKEAWGRPQGIVCDRFRVNELRDAVNGTPVSARVSQWSESAFDIRSLRKGAKDGPFAVAEDSRPLLEASLFASMVQNDASGNFRLVKKDPANNRGRDDVAASCVLAAGVFARMQTTKPSGGLSLGPC